MPPWHVVHPLQSHTHGPAARSQAKNHVHPLHGHEFCWPRHLRGAGRRESGTRPPPLTVIARVTRSAPSAFHALYL